MVIPSGCGARRMDGYRDHGGTRFPHPPARRRVWEGYALKQEAWGNRVSPRPPTRGRVWEGCALPGEPLYPNCCDRLRLRATIARE